MSILALNRVGKSLVRKTPNLLGVDTRNSFTPVISTFARDTPKRVTREKYETAV